MTHHRDGARPDGLSVLVVCRANRYRSPLAEHLLRAALDAELASAGATIEVSSAGTDATPGERLDPAVAALLDAAGVAPSPGWRATRLTAAAIADADVVLSSDHLRSADVTRLDPAALRRVFTVRQFARYMSAVAQDGHPLTIPAPSPAAAVQAHVDRLRGHLPAVRPAEDDLEDPVRRPGTLLRRCAVQLTQDSAAIALGLRHILV